MHRTSLLVNVLLGLTGVAVADWDSLLQTSSGPGTIYGKGANSKGACAFGTNFADTTGLPWSTPPAGASDGGTGQDITYIAMNKADFAGSTACGACIWFRGTGTGIGVESKKISTQWQYGLVDNVCPECPKGALDLARSFNVGDGIWNVEWYAVPCQVGDTPLHYSFVQSSPYYFNLVISNTRVPVSSVSITIGGKDVELTRASNNFWTYHNSDGMYSFPMDITVTPVCGSAVTDTIKSATGGDGSKQFSADGCTSQGNPVSGGGGNSGGGLSTESSGSAERATAPRHSDTTPTPAPTPAPTSEPPASEQRQVLEAPPQVPPSVPLLEPPSAPLPASPPQTPDLPPQGPPDAPPQTPTTPPPTPDTPPSAAPNTPPATPPNAPETPPADPPAQPPQAPPAEPTAPLQQPPASPRQSPPQTPPESLPQQPPASPAEEPPASPPQQPPKQAQQPPLEPAQQPPAEPVSQPPAEPVSQPPAEPVGQPPAEPVGQPPADPPASELSETMQELFGGFLNPDTGLAVLPKWFQCGDTNGKYPQVICGTEGFDCVYINFYYWQCRDDAGGPSVQGRRRLASQRQPLRGAQ